tara:strand:- start:12972 stop:14072 length:1101 start_codon:yes stop_codon:yes gene_type:complete
MQIQLTQKSDDPNLRKFFEQIPIPGSIEYKVERPSGFFAHAEQNFAATDALMLSDEEKIHACLSINTREAFLQDWKNIGWATDLRLSSNRKAVRYFFDHFLEDIKKLRREKNLDFILSFINKTNQIAFNTFIRPRSLRENHPRFHLLTNFYRVSVYAKIPFLYFPLQTLRIRSLDNHNIEALSRYLARKAKRRFLAYRYSVELLEQRMNQWINFNKENFLIAYDARGNIVGCVAPWNTRKTQRYEIIKYNDFYENMRQLNRITSYMGITKNMPAPGSMADFYFLTHLNADNPYIFHRLLHESLQFCSNDQYLVYTSFENDRLYKPPKDVVHTKSKFGLYLVLEPGEDLPFTHLPSDTIPDFEIAFL